MPISKTKMLSLVKSLQWPGVEAALREQPHLRSFRDPRGRTWLHLGAGVEVGGDTGRTARASVRLAGVLLEAGLDVNDAAFVEGDWCATPLWYAVSRARNRTLAKFLLAEGSTPEHCLWAAAYHEDVPMLRLLVDAGAPLDAIAEDETPLLHAVKTSRFRAARFLLEAGSDPDFQDADQMTALHYMLRKGSDRKQIELFVKHGARGDIEDGSGRTATEILLRKRDKAFHRVAARLRPGL